MFQNITEIVFNLIKKYHFFKNIYSKNIIYLVLLQKG